MSTELNGWATHPLRILGNLLITWQIVPNWLNYIGRTGTTIPGKEKDKIKEGFGLARGDVILSFIYAHILLNHIEYFTHIVYIYTYKLMMINTTKLVCQTWPWHDTRFLDDILKTLLAFVWVSKLNSLASITTGNIYDSRLALHALNRTRREGDIYRQIR